MPKRAFDFYGGWGGIRTPGRVAPSTVFKTVAFDRSATHPELFKLVRIYLRTGPIIYYFFINANVKLCKILHTGQNTNQYICPKPAEYQEHKFFKNIFWLWTVFVIQYW